MRYIYRKTQEDPVITKQQTPGLIREFGCIQNKYIFFLAINRKGNEEKHSIHKTHKILDVNLARKVQENNIIL